MADTVRFPDEMSASFTGELIAPGEEGYELARRVHNGLIDKRPALIARCRTVPDIQDAVIIGREQAAKGTNVDLGPTINIVRDPRWGRAFESIGEDPYLNGQLGAADIRGVQSTGVMAQVKHYAVYNQETNRNSSNDNAVISTQAEQEIYLPAFQAATQQGAASSVMCSYSWINGTAACQNSYTLNTVLRQQFGYTGFVTSDWGATHSTAASANAAFAQKTSSRRRTGGGVNRS